MFRRFRSDEKGAAMVEMALVLGVIFLPMVFGVIEFGRGVWAKTTITAAAREGVRFAAVRGTDYAAAGNTVADSTAVADYVKARTQLTGIVVRPTWTPDKNPGSDVKVQVTYNYVPIIPLFSSRVIQSTSKQRIAY